MPLWQNFSRMELKWKIKPFEALTVNELYDLLKLRSEIFVVEQNCVYLDLDGKDKKALHLLGEFEGKIVAYSRLFDAGISFDNASIGRVVVDANYRDKKWGHELMINAIAGIKSNFDKDKITIGAQLYLQKFYESHGFVQTSEMYLEDDIPHIEMIRG
ncbi:ElaA protein [Flavobacterium cutihirudinis]|uniref:ElaA protein n=2 Tax=Flavobacterium cutihirudinis TaxID=1265740 RepID=A0A3D9FVT2_9FLAO|nr:ElaA protein [Flavobacterium cutihirudinis]